MTRVSRFCVPAVLTWAIGCTAGEDLDHGTTQQNVASENALSVNALGWNALGWNALGWNALGWNALGWNALGWNALGWNALGWNGESATDLMMERPVTRRLFEYLVSCAVPDGYSVEIPCNMVDQDCAGNDDWSPISFWGKHGLAPEWAGYCSDGNGGWEPCGGTPTLSPEEQDFVALQEYEAGQDGYTLPPVVQGACDETCQRWISACLLARINLYEQPVAISMRGNHEALAASSEEVQAYSLQEGAVWGNLFADPPQLYTCYGVHYHNTNATLRACTHLGGMCPMTIVGPCGPSWNGSASSNLTYNPFALAGTPVLEGSANLTQGHYQNFPVANVVNDQTVVTTTHIGITVYLQPPEALAEFDYAGFDPQQDVDTATEMAQTAICGNGICELGECGDAHIAELVYDTLAQEYNVETETVVCQTDCGGCVGEHCATQPLPETH
jgi:hypothetical protein